jgi:magnesium chelatase family protein
VNPCPCGYFGDPKRECRCSTRQVEQYRSRISGPLLDRIDLHLEVPVVEFRQLAGKQPGESSAALRERILSAREIQRQRYGEGHRVRCNARMTPQQQKTVCALDSTAEGLLQMAMDELQLSARAFDRILKVARTIADLAGQKTISPEHIGEAIQYRTLDRKLFG